MEKRKPGFKFNYREKCYECSPDQLDIIKEIMLKEGLGYNCTLFQLTKAIEKLVPIDELIKYEIESTKPIEVTLNEIKKYKLLEG